MIEAKPFRKRLIVIEPDDGEEQNFPPFKRLKERQEEAAPVRIVSTNGSVKSPTTTGLSAGMGGGASSVAFLRNKNIGDCLQIHDEHNEVNEDSTVASSLSSASTSWSEGPTASTATPIIMKKSPRTVVALAWGSYSGCLHNQKNSTSEETNNRQRDRAMGEFTSNPPPLPIGKPLRAPPKLPQLGAWQSVKRPQTAKF